jgi:hypothetical protein
MPVAIEGEHWPTEVGYDPEPQVETLVRKTSIKMSFPETVSDSLCRNTSVMQTQFHQLVSDDPAGEEARC